jgi:hypothetical protein
LIKNFVNKILANGSFYLGEYNNDLPNGHGILITQAGYLYRGQFKDGDLLGPMVGISPTGEVLVSEFLDGKPKNDTGLSINLEGSVRKIWGPNEAPTISVTDFYPDGNIFKGQMDNNKPNGFGFTFKSNGEIYRGGYKNGAAHGNGVLIKTDGSIYQGQFVDGQGDGIGALVKLNGDIYYGQFFDSHPEGLGILVKYGQFIFKGNIINGKGEGRGIVITESNMVYSGEFKQGRIHGYGRMYWLGTDFYGDEFAEGESQNVASIAKNDCLLHDTDLSESEESARTSLGEVNILIELDSSTKIIH